MKLSLTILLGLSCIAIASANAATITLDTKLTTTGGTSSSLYEDFHPGKLNPSLEYEPNISVNAVSPFSFSADLGAMHSTGTGESFKLTSISIIGASTSSDTELSGSFNLSFTVNGKNYSTTCTSTSMGDTNNHAYLNFDFSSLNLQLSSSDKITFTITTTESVSFNPIIVAPKNDKNTISGSEYPVFPNASPIISIKGESIPEPSTTALAGLGLASLLLRRRRKS